jgi:hypothetical protein
MKTLSICLGFVCLAFYTHAQHNDRYVNAMKKNVSTLDTAQRSETFQYLMHNFERIAKMEKTQWLPSYYTALCACSLSGKEKDNNLAEELSDKAEAYLAIADSLSPNNAEISVMKAQIAFVRIKVDVMERGIKNSMQAGQLLKKAIQIDAQNPRAYFLIGMGKYSMPEQVGGDKKAACQLFEKSAELFSKEDKQSIMPHWGTEEVASILQRCRKASVKTELTPAQSGK